MVNAGNPINNLTKQQIKDIYSGKITNWKELGGNDVTILPLQRTAGGSQSGMLDFMGDTKIMVPFVDAVIDSMSGLIERVTQEPNAIGYSYYYYTNTMYLNNAKLLNLEGVAPSNANVENGSYPEITPYFAVFRADAPVGSFPRIFTEYLLSPAGQQTAENTGYVKLSASQIVPLPEPEQGYAASPPAQMVDIMS
jgi:phosphate transport system substrate-binding protein